MLPCKTLHLARHLQTEQQLLSCHRPILDSPKSQLTRLPGWQQMYTALLKAVGHLSADLGLRAVTTMIWRPPGDKPVTSRAEQRESSFCCRYLCLYVNSCRMVSIFNSCSFQRYCRIHMMVCIHKPQEAEKISAPEPSSPLLWRTAAAKICRCDRWAKLHRHLALHKWSNRPKFWKTTTHVDCAWTKLGCPSEESNIV